MPASAHAPSVSGRHRWHQLEGIPPMYTGWTEVTPPLVALRRFRVGFGRVNGHIPGGFSHGLALTFCDDQASPPNWAAVLSSFQGMLSSVTSHAACQMRSRVLICASFAMPMRAGQAEVLMSLYGLDLTPRRVWSRERYYGCLFPAGEGLRLRIAW